MLKIIFKLVLKLQLVIDKIMKDLKLQPGKYVSVYFRTGDSELSMIIKDNRVLNHQF